jgi:hypothetical protein
MAAGVVDAVALVVVEVVEVAAAAAVVPTTRCDG